MLTKSQTLTAIQKSLIKYNELVASQITTKINTHNTVATTAAQGHMSAAMVTKLNGIADGAEVNQNAISKIQIGSDVVTASGKESTATFKGGNGVSVAFDDANAISITGVNASTTAKGVVQLTDGVASTSTTTAATANAAKTAYDKANAAQGDLNNFKTTVSSTYMPIAGGAFTGEVTLKADPTANLGAATKQYVDNKVSGLNIGNYMLKSGGTFTGAVTLSGAPTADLHAATKKYVDDTAAAAAAKVVDSAPGTLDTLNELAAALGDNPNFATTVAEQIGTKVDKVDGKGLSTNDYTTADKNKLAGIAAGAEVNQNAFATIGVKVGTATTNVVADTKTDTVTFIQGDNVTLTPDATNDTITIAAKDTTYGVATTGANGLMSKDDKTKLNGIAGGAEVNQNAFSNVKVGTTTIASGAKTATLELAAGSNVTLTPDATGKKVTIASKDTKYSKATTSADGLMSKEDKAKLDGIVAEADVTDEEITTMMGQVQAALSEK